MTHAAIDHTPKERAGIGSAVLNASRQVGGVVGIALLGALIGGRFVVGMHRGMVLAGALLLLGSGLRLGYAVRSRRVLGRAAAGSRKSCGYLSPAGATGLPANPPPNAA